jgi:hypothetical protein
MFGRTSAPTSADAGIVKTDRKDVGVPLSVVLQPEFVGAADCEAWACVKLRKEASTAEAWRKLVRAIVNQLLRT